MSVRRRKLTKIVTQLPSLAVDGWETRLVAKKNKKHVDVLQRISRKLRRSAKRLWWKRLSHLEHYQQIVFVVGCQRSGTTLILDCFDKDLRTVVFRDQSELSGHRGDRLRLKPHEEVESILAMTRCPIVVAKPLLDSQRTCELLDDYPRSKALWVMRDYRGVIGSSLRKFSGQIENVRRVLEEPDDWRGECVSDETRDFIAGFYRSDMQREDAAALMWVSRNQFFFDQALNESPEVSIVSYEDLVQQRDVAMRRIYDFLGVSFPARPLTNSIHQHALGRGKDVKIDSGIQDKCEAIQMALRKHYEIAIGMTKQGMSAKQ